MKKFFITFLFGLSLSVNAFSQDMKLPAPSPTAVIKQDFSTSSIEITYSRPSMRGRKIFGDLIPFGQVWRTGANAATKISFGEDVMLAGQALKAGTYALYTTPGENSWKVIINKGISNWGISGFDEKDDVIQFDIPAKKTADAVKSFTIAIENLDGNKCDLVLSWENTKVTIPVLADNNKKITEYLETSINNPKRPYQQAANYYLETNQNLDKAIEYTDKALAENKDAFWLYWLKARIYQKQGKKTEAIAAAQKSADLAASTPYAAEYKRNAETLKKQMM
jgi:tetratricopeptide (TPR) repeat protein